MEKEFKVVLKENATGKLVPQQREDNVIGTKWVFKVKSNEDGTIERFKIRLVANGMRQTNYMNTFSEVLCPKKTHNIRIGEPC